jgi:PAS domain S-box-containing protein
LFGIVDSGFTKDVKGWLELVHPDERAELRRYWTGQVLERKVDFDRTYRIIRQNDRQERWVHGIGKLVLDGHGHVTQMVGVIQDITERKCADEQIDLQSRALTAVANAIAITDSHGKIEWVNPAFTRLTGYSATEAVGGYPRVLKSGQHPPAFYATLWATIITGNIWHGELVNKRKDGKHYTEEMTITPVRGADGLIAHFVAVKQDVTERRQLENQLRQAQKLEAVGTLAGGIAHDFNNILGAIIAFTEMTKMDHQGDAELQDNLDEVLKASQRASTLVRQILAFSRQQQLKRSCVQISSVVKEVLKLLRATLPSTIAIEQGIAANLPDVLADVTQIHQVMMNLCTNAAHAMRGTQGRLRVQLDALHLPPEEPLPDALLAAGDYVRLIVSDTGHGMTAEILERIFEPFFTTKGPGEGTGLGLSVVHGIVKEHGGVIAVESEPGRGTTFTIYLPAQPVSENKGNANRVEIPKGNGERVLFVDDELALGKVAHKVLQQLGYQTFVFSDARAAWKALQENPAAYDVLITDLTMPGMTGLELAQRVFQLRPDLPIVLSSGTVGALTLTESQALGIREMLNKPLDYHKLAQALHQVLHEPSRAK